MAKYPPTGTSHPSSSGANSPDSGTSTSKSKRKRETLASLRSDLDDVVARLRQADNLTQQSVKSLQTAFSVLEKRVAEDSHVNKAALTLRVDQLSEHLTGLIKKTQSAVAQDLKQARENPTIEKLSAAVKSAEARISDTEILQAAALTKVNRHIADLAKAVDARLTADAKTHKANFAAVTETVKSSQERTERKLSEIERTSAEAILKVGERVVSLSDDIRERTEKSTQILSDKVAEIASKTKQDFDVYRSEVEAYRTRFERRVESLEETQRNLDSYTDRSIAKLTARIDNLEYGLTNVAPPAPVQTSHGAQAAALNAPSIDDPFEPDPIMDLHTHRGDTARTGGPAALTLVPAPVENSQTAAARPKPFGAPFTGHAAPSATTPAENQPVQYDNTGAFVPTEFVPSSAPNSSHVVNQNSSPRPYPERPSHLAPSEPEELYHPAQEYVGGPKVYVAADNPEAIMSDDLPYDDPAYAEHGELGLEPSMQRPASFSKRAKTSLPIPKLTNRKLQVAGLAIIVATVGYFALRGTQGQPTRLVEVDTAPPVQSVNQSPDTPSQNETSLENNTGNITASADLSLPAIGEYQDNQGLTQSGEPAKPGTLEDAAQNGDPVAEFQLGLSKLQAGNTEEAISLIRSAANKGQPAAQYRLAKLYEAGQGVTADAAMARQLTERAAINGNRIAMHDLALYYAEGRGDVAVNIKTAAQWFEKAAQRGVVDSQYNLGVLYESGQGLPKNLTEALVWYSIAAGQGDQFAKKHIVVLKEQIAEGDIQRAEQRVKAFTPVAIDEPANGIFRNVAWKLPEAEAAKDARAQVTETQILLGQLGYDAGSADGSMGPKTRSAIKSFQREKGLTQTGQVDESLLLQLQQASGA